MRIVRFRTAAGPQYGVAEDTGEEIRVLDHAPYGDELRETGARASLAEVELLTPVEPGKILAIGRNYSEHAREMGFEIPASPSVFMKPRETLLATGGTVVLPDPTLSHDIEHEAELAVVIGRGGRRIPAEQALAHVFGYTCANDVSARDLQRTDTNPTRAKGFDTFCPLGPWVRTGVDPADLRITCRVDEELRQDASTAQMIFDVPAIIASVSQWTTLVPGDVILTGSPAGTGALVDGSRVEIEIEGIGTLRHAAALP